MVENNRILEGLLLEWENFHSINQKQSSKQKPNHQMKQQWSMVMIRDSLPQNDLSVFPPINHENLHRQNQQQQQHNPPPKSTLSPPSDARDITPSVAGRGIGDWLGTGLEILRAKIVSLACYFGYKDGKFGRAFGSFGRVIGVAAVVLLWWLCKRVRRRRCREENVEQLKMIIKEKDERIRGLLSQIAEMNEVLIARHKAIASKLTN
ncbi:putative kinase [Corchorus capsularis]|uniref:Putative kinase n=1 Tax=Corchorus capsularis TaxID=210143 RepID=A0A1R3KHF5_COCAP|nr:putative kinase [Corchorus capsularis]